MKQKTNYQSSKKYLDQHAQPYLVSNDSYFYLAALKQEDKDTHGNLLVSFYRGTSSALVSLFGKTQKFYLYYFPYLAGLLAVLIFYLGLRFAVENHLAVFGSILLIANYSFNINTQLGLIDHNAFYVLAFVVILFITLYFDCNTREPLELALAFIIFMLVLYMISTFWGSWYLLLIPAVTLGVWRFIEYKKLSPAQKLGILALSSVFFYYQFLSNSSYISIVLSKLLGTSESVITRLTYTEELKGFSFVELVSIEPISVLFIIFSLLTLLKFREKMIQSKVLPWFLSLLFFTILTLLFKRMSVFFVITGIVFLILFLEKVNIKAYLKITLFLVCLLISGYSYSSLNISSRSIDRVSDTDIRKFKIISKLTEDKAVILAWWDQGYLIKAISERYAFLDPGSRSTNDRLSLFAEIIYNNNNNAIERVRKLSCEDLSRKDCTKTNTPIYLLLDDEFDYFHQIASRFVKFKQQELTSSSDLIKEVFVCNPKSKLLQCGEHEFSLGDGVIKLVSEHKFQKFIFHSMGKLNVSKFKNTGDALVLLKFHGGYKAVVVSPAIEKTMLFRSLFYSSDQVFSHEKVYEDSYDGRFVILKLTP